MAADLHIHVLTKVATEQDLANFFSQLRWDDPRRETAWQNVSSTPNVWIGEVSWLKAGLFEDDESFIPDPVMRVAELVPDGRSGTMPILTSELLEKICEAVAVPVQAKASYYETTDADKVREFLTPHIGRRLFSISW